MKTLLNWHRRRKLLSYEARLAGLEAKYTLYRSLEPTRPEEGLPRGLIEMITDCVEDIAVLKVKIADLKEKLNE